jgi:hypothetical protein
MNRYLSYILSIDDSRLWNIIILTLIILTFVTLYLCARRTRILAALDGTHGAANATYWFFITAFLLILCDYWLDYWGHLSREMFSPTYLVYAVLGNIAIACTFAAAMAYLLGRKFPLPAAFIPMLVFILVISVWDIIWWLLVHYRHSTVLQMFALSPHYVLAIAAFLSLGFSFLVPWYGPAGIAFFSLCVGYALLQFPAGLFEDFPQVFDPNSQSQGGTHINSPLQFVYLWLAWGKVFVAAGFLSLLCSEPIPRDPRVAYLKFDIDEPKVWPSGAVRAPSHWWRIFWALFTGAIIHTIFDLFKGWLYSSA